MVFKVRTCTITADSLLFPKAHPSFCFRANGDGEIRTLDPLLARQVLSQLSYTPTLSLFTFLFYKSGTHLLSHIVSNTVPSAGWGLTIVFGMGTGVSPRRIATGNILLCLFLPAIRLRIRHRKYFTLAPLPAIRLRIRLRKVFDAFTDGRLSLLFPLLLHI